MARATLLHVMIALTGIGVAAAFAVPSILAARIEANEAAAIGTLRSMTATTTPESDVEPVRGGYRFRAFRASAVWCCYAWPTTRATTGNRTFFVGPDGVVVGTDCDAYSGPGRFTPANCGAAFARPGATTSITGVVARGTRGRDGNLWRLAE